MYWVCIWLYCACMLYCVCIVYWSVLRVFACISLYLHVLRIGMCVFVCMARIRVYLDWCVLRCMYCLYCMYVQVLLVLMCIASIVVYCMYCMYWIYWPVLHVLHVFTCIWIGVYGGVCACIFYMVCVNGVHPPARIGPFVSLSSLVPSFGSRVTLGSWFPHMTDTPRIFIWNRAVSKEGFSKKNTSSKNKKKPERWKKPF